MSSLIILKGRRKETSNEHKRNVAKIVGISFIELRYKQPINTPQGPMGFQCVEIWSRKLGPGKSKNTVNWSKDDFGNDAPRGELVFVPDGELDVGTAFLPDSPYNRRKLAITTFLSPIVLWNIVDKTIEKEIKDIADAIKQSDEYKANVKAVETQRNRIRLALEQEKRTRGGGDKIVSEQEAKIAMLEKQLVDLESEKKIKELQDRISELEGKAGIPPAGKLVKSAIDKNNKRRIKKEVETEIYEEKKDVIEDLRKKYRHRFALSTEYRARIKPLVDQRVKDRLQNEHSGVGVSD